MKARKQHKCTLCGEPIERGEDYFYERVPPWTHIDNEKFYTFRAHQKCNEIWVKVGAEYEWVLPYPSDFKSHLEHIGREESK